MKRTTYQNEEVNLALIKQDVSYVKDTVKDIKLQLQSEYVTKDQFAPIQKLVYGITGVILVAVVVGLMNILLK